MQHKLTFSWYVASFILVGLAFIVMFISIWRQIDKQVEWSLVGASESDPVIEVTEPKLMEACLAQYQSLPKSSYLPNHPFYLGMMIYERLKLWLTFNEIDKVNLYLKYANERMGVSGQMVAKGRGKEAIESAAKGYMYDMKAAEILRLYQTEEAKKWWGELAKETSLHQAAMTNLETIVADNLKLKVKLVVDGLGRLQKEATMKAGGIGE